MPFFVGTRAWRVPKTLFNSAQNLCERALDAFYLDKGLVLKLFFSIYPKAFLDISPLIDLSFPIVFIKYLLKYVFWGKFFFWHWPGISQLFTFPESFDKIMFDILNLHCWKVGELLIKYVLLAIIEVHTGTNQFDLSVLKVGLIDFLRKGFRMR